MDTQYFWNFRNFGQPDVHGPSYSTPMLNIYSVKPNSTARGSKYIYNCVLFTLQVRKQSHDTPWNLPSLNLLKNRTWKLLLHASTQKYCEWWRRRVWISSRRRVAYSGSSFKNIKRYVYQHQQSHNDDDVNCNLFGAEIVHLVLCCSACFVTMPAEFDTVMSISLALLQMAKVIW